MLVEGRLKQETWEKDGQKRSKVKVICEKMQMIGGKQGGGGGGGGNSAPRNDYSEPATTSSSAAPGDDNIPF